LTNEVIVKFRTESATGSWNLLSRENLVVLGKNPEEIKEVIYMDYFPHLPYMEKGVAWSPHHPLIGSGTVCVVFADGSRGYIDDIFYQDFNPKQTHADGKPHWNHERRYFLSTWDREKMCKEPEYHQIAKSASIEITTRAPGQAEKQVNCYWRE
jgi:hypothetical protein